MKKNFSNTTSFNLTITNSEGAHIIMLRDQDRTPPVPLLNKEENRLKTFNNWSIRTIDKQVLAQTGFIHIGPSDLVKCYFCNVEIGMWQEEDNIVDEHIRWSPNCPLILNKPTSNQPICSEALKRILPCYVTYRSTNTHPSLHQHPEYTIGTHRLASFEDWPIALKQRPRELAEAGFYYTGRGDRVVCFSCGGGLKDWTDSDVPFEEHATLYSKCDYLKMVKGQKYIDEILFRKKELVSPSEKTRDIKTCSENPNENKLCKICYERECNMVFIPCGHIIGCEKCVVCVSKCPYCQQRYKKVIRVYFP